MSDEEFREASRIVKRTCKFFPTIAQVFELKDVAINTLHRKAIPGRAALPIPTEEEKEDQEASAAMYAKSVELAKSGMSYEEMANEMETFRHTLLRN
jgi:hypothetical protein